MEDRKSGTNRRSARKPRATRCPPASEVTGGVRLMRVIDGGAATLSEPVIDSGIPEAFRQLPLRLVEQPVTDASRPLTVLLIDDNHDHRTPLLRALRAESYDVLFASDGARGQDLFQTSLREFDALIARAEMKNMSGFEVARLVRSVQPEIAVLLMCRSSTSPEHADSPFDRGFPVIEEPFTPEQLTRRLAEVLAASRSKDCFE